MKSIGNRITKLREGQGLTRYRLAIKSGVSFSYVAALEENKHSPSLEVLEKIASGLGISMAQLFEEESEKYRDEEEGLE